MPTQPVTETYARLRHDCGLPDGEERSVGGDFKEHTSFFDRAVSHGAEAWHRLDREEADARRQRAVQRGTQTRRRASHNSRVHTVVKVWPEVMRAAMKAAGGDASRLRIVSDTEVWVI